MLPSCACVDFNIIFLYIYSHHKRLYYGLTPRGVVTELKDYFYYVPLLNSLQALLNNEDRLIFWGMYMHDLSCHD